MPPEKIGRYQIQEEIGRGGMATVYKAYDPRFGRSVAVKMLPREFLHEPEFRARFEREARTIAMLEHPAIVPVYDFGEEDGQPYLVMRHMPGGSLADRLAQGPISIPETAEILQRIGDALERAHAQGVIHRDLKPSNILFDQYGDAFLADFGIVRIISSDSALTASGSLVGTPTYMSPEQVYGDKELDGRSDIYALGIILFQMLTGSIPYEADTPAKVMMKHVMDPVPEILALRPDLPPSANEIITKAMAKEPNERFSTATDLTRAIKTMSTPPPAQPDLADELANLRSQIAPELDEATAANQPTESPAAAEKQGPRTVPDLSQPDTAVPTPPPSATPTGPGPQTIPDLSQPDTAVPTPPPPAPTGPGPQTIPDLSQPEPPEPIATPTPPVRSEPIADSIAIPDLGQPLQQPKATTPSYNDITYDDAKPSRAIPLWIWGVLTVLLLLCVGTIGGGIWLINNRGPEFISSVGIIADEELTATVVEQASITPNATGTILAEGRLQTATAIAEQADNPPATAVPATAIPDTDNDAAAATREALIATREAEANAGSSNNDDNSGSSNDVAATRAALLATREAEAGNAPPVVDLPAQLAPAVGPSSGIIPHEPDDGRIESQFAGDAYADFMVDVTFTNPYDTATEIWDVGIFFRQTEADNELRLVVRADGEWNLNDRQGADNFIAEGDVSDLLNTAVNDTNQLRLIAIGEHGFFYLNGRFVAALDLSSRTTIGDLAIATGFYSNSEQPNATTDYTDFTVYELSPTFGPSSGELEHIDDNLIKSRSASVDLANLYTSATFVNPYGEDEGTWDFGFAFRDTAVGEQYWLVVESAGLWSLYNRVNGEDIFLEEGTVDDIVTGDGGENQLTLLAQNSSGILLFNNTFIAELDLSDRLNTGDVLVFTAYFVGNEIPGNATGYSDFVTVPLP